MSTVNQISDYNEIISGCIRNDRKAQEKLFRLFHGSMWALCKSYLANDFDASEAVNDGFMKVFKHIGKFDPARASLYTWMRKIMTNTALDTLKGKKRLVFSPIETALFEEPEIENSLLGSYDAEQIIALINQLPDSTRTVFNLYTLEGYDHKEIAEMLNITSSTSRWHLAVARKKLKDLLKAFKS